jgi:hypothetical protein
MNRTLLEEWWLVLALLFLAWGVRLLAYGTAELGLDGHLSVGLALLPVPRLLEFLARDVHPPFFYLTLKAWLRLVSVSYLSVRWIGVAAGTLTLAVLYRFVRSLAGPRGALVAVALFVLSPDLISASATVRDFGLGLFFSIASLAAWRALDCPCGQRRRRTYLVALALMTALALATWYLHALFVVTQVVALVVNPRDWRARVSALVAGMAVQVPWAIVAVSPLVAKVSQGVTVSGQIPSAAPLRTVLSDLGASFAGGLPTSFGHVVAFGAWLVLVGVGIARADAESGSPRGWAFIAFFGLSTGLLAVYGLASRWAGASLLGRYGLVLVPWAALAQAWAFGSVRMAAPVGEDGAISAAPVEVHDRAPPRSAGVRSSRQASRRSDKGAPPVADTVVTSSLATFGLLALVSIVLIGQTTDFLSLERLEGLPWERQIPPVAELDLLQRDAQPVDLIVFSDLARAGQYALRGGGRPATTTVHVAGSTFLRDDVASIGALLGSPLGNRSRVWLLYDRPIDAASLGSIVDLLTEQRYLTREATFGNAVVDRFELGPVLDQHAGLTHFGASIVLADWAISPTAVVGGTAFVDLHWQASAPVGASYTVFVHLIDGTGQKIAQHDGEPALGSRPTASWRPGETIDDRVALAIPASARPGTYHVLVGLYRGADRLTVVDGGDALEIGPIEVTAQ